MLNGIQKAGSQSPWGFTRTKQSLAWVSIEIRKKWRCRNCSDFPYGIFEPTHTRKIRARRMQRLLADLEKIADLMQNLQIGGRAYGEAKLLMRVMQRRGTCVDYVLFVRWSRNQQAGAKHSKPYAPFPIREAKKSPYGKNNFWRLWHGDCNIFCCHRSFSGSMASSPPPIARDARPLKGTTVRRQ